MKQTKIVLSLVSVMALVGLSGCGEQSSSNGNEEGQASATTTVAKKDPDLIYRSWDLGTEKANNEERRLIKAFEEKEGVKIKVVENAGTGNAYWDGIKASVTTKIDLADVMMIPNLDWPLSSGFLYDVSQFTQNDAEFAAIPESIKDACTFKSGVYAIPARMNLQGYFLNVSMVEKDLNLVGASDYSVNSPSSIITDIINAADARNDRVALDSAAHFIDTQASVNDESKTQGYFTWDGEQYHLDEAPFITAVQQAANLYSQGKTLDSYDDLAKEELGLDLSIEAKVDAWDKGKLALRYGYTFEIPDMLEKNDLSNQYRFIGNPGGKVTIVGDYYGIYKETKNPELAYKFAKYMSFGIEGFNKRMDLYEEKGAMNSLPLTNDAALIEDYFSRYGASSNMSGLEEAFEYIKENSMVEGVKVVPGYLMARQNKKTGANLSAQETNVSMFTLLDACYKGKADITSFTSGTTNIDTIADKTYTDWLERYGKDYQ